MFLPVFAAALMLVPVTAGDARIEKRRTFVSEEARTELARTNGDRVLCLDRKRQRSICLTESQWQKAVALAEAQSVSRKGARDFVPVYESNLGLTAQIGYHPAANP